MTYQDANNHEKKLERLQHRGDALLALSGSLSSFREFLFDGLETFAYSPTFVHNDGHYQNVIDSPRGLQLIDFGNTGYGDGLRDVAYAFVFAERPAQELGFWVEDYQQAFAALAKSRATPGIGIGEDPLRRTAHHVAIIRMGRFLSTLGAPEGMRQPLTWWRGQQLCADLCFLEGIDNAVKKNRERRPGQ